MTSQLYTAQIKTLKINFVSQKNKNLKYYLWVFISAQSAGTTSFLSVALLHIFMPVVSTISLI